MKKSVNIIISSCVAMIAFIAILIVINKVSFKPINADRIETVHITIANLAEYSFEANLEQKECINQIIDFESLVNDSKGVNGLANAVIWRINITYKLKDGKEIERSYKGQESTNELISALIAIKEIQESMKTGN